MKYLWVILALIAMWLSFYGGSEINDGSVEWWSFPYVITSACIIAFFINKVLKYKW